MRTCTCQRRRPSFGMDRMDVELASCAHRRAKVVRFAPRTWGHGGMSGASKGAWLHGMFELWFEEALHAAALATVRASQDLEIRSGVRFMRV